MEVLSRAPHLAGRTDELSYQQMLDVLEADHIRKKREAAEHAETRKADFFDDLNATGHAVTVGINRALDGKAWEHVEAPEEAQGSERGKGRVERLRECERQALAQEAAYIAKLHGEPGEA